MRSLNTFIFALLLVSCAIDDNANKNASARANSLQALIDENSVAFSNVIACSASSTSIENGFEVYFYPRPNSTNYQYWVSSSSDINPNNFRNYSKKEVTIKPLFNGYLQAFLDKGDTEKWVVVSFNQKDSLHLSNPIRLKHLQQPTVFSDAVEISEDSMPIFNWEAPVNSQTAIYFEVISNSENNLLSGTYTLDTNFQYYNLDNVVLNITRETPPSLIEGEDYMFTMMAVSEDNWVNVLIEKPFQQ